MRALDTQEGILGCNDFEIVYPEPKNKPILHLTNDHLTSLHTCFENDTAITELIRVYRLVKEGKI